MPSVQNVPPSNLANKVTTLYRECLRRAQHVGRKHHYDMKLLAASIKEEFKKHADEKDVEKIKDLKDYARNFLTGQISFQLLTNTAGRPSELILTKTRLTTSTFTFYDAILSGFTIITNDGVNFSSRSVMKLRETERLQCIYNRFVRSRQFPNIIGSWKPLDVQLKVDEVYIVYDHCFEITLSDFIKKSFEMFVLWKYGRMHIKRPTSILLRNLIEMAKTLESYNLQDCMNAELMFTDGNINSFQILMDISGEINNHDVLLSFIENTFLIGAPWKACDELQELLDLLKKRDIRNNNIDKIPALATTGTITRRLSCVSEALTRELDFRMEFNKKYTNLRGWKEKYPM